MSAKRPATTDLNHGNWDQDDPSEHEEMGSFKSAPKEIIEKRVIRTAKRRSHITNSPLLGSQGSTDEPKKPVFSGFGGFNKTQPSSFDFLANLTNGNRNSSSSDSKNDTTPSRIFSNKPSSTNPSNGIFGVQASAESTPKSTFGIPSSQSSVFGIAATSTPSSIFTASKTDSTVQASPFNIPVTSTSSDASALPDVKTTTGSGPQVSSSMFGVPPASNSSKLFTDSSKPIFGNNSITTPKNVQANSGSLFTSSPSADKAAKTTETQDEKKSTYYTKLKGLNLSVSDWIKKHVEETPLCILSPIFKDYEKYLKEIQDEYNGDSKKSEDKPSTNNSAFSMQNNTTVPKSSGFSLGSNTKLSTPQPTGFSLGSNVQLPTSQSTGFALGSNTLSPSSQSKGFALGTTTQSPNSQSTGFALGTNTQSPTSQSTGFVLESNTKLPIGQSGLEQTKQVGFGTVSSLPQSTSTPGSSLFSNNTSTNGASPFSFGYGKGTTSPTGAEETKTVGFGIATSPQTTSASSPFSANTSGSTPFSFGMGKPFGFNNVQKLQTSSETNNENEEADAPPKVEYKPIVEDNSVYEKKCKVFVKKDGNYADKGVGTLYVKKIEDNGKHQLLVRANTSLGNVLINLILSSAIPIQRMGKNNVMMVCIPTPDSTPPPVPMLIRVKTPEEADELLETLNKYKT